MTPTAKQHLLFGGRHPSLETALTALADQLPLAFRMRDSSYLGGLYYLARPAAPHAASLKLYSNRDEGDGQAIRRDHPDYPILLEAEDVTDAGALTALLASMGFVTLT